MAVDRFGMGAARVRLSELDPRFLRFARDAEGRALHITVDSLAEAHGVMFLCPLCYQANGGRVGTHRVICWSRSRGTPEDASPGPGRWTLEGTGFDDLTLNGDAIGGGGARSVLLTSGCGWHGFVTNGEAA